MISFAKQQRASLPYSIIITVLLVAVCYLLQISWHLQDYFLSAMLGTAAAFCIAISWGVYLYRDKLLQTSESSPKKRLPGESAVLSGVTALNDENDFLQTFNRGLIPRPPPERGSSQKDKDWPLIMQHAFLCAALLLLGFTVGIYYLLGIGANYIIGVSFLHDIAF